MSYDTKTITTSATKILSTPSNAGRKSGLITNTSTEIVYIGFDSSLTTATGFPLNQYDVWSTNEPRTYQGDIYGIVAANTADVRIQELL